MLRLRIKLFLRSNSGSRLHPHKMCDTYHPLYPPDPDKYRLMRVNCTGCLRCMGLTNSFNSLRLRGQQEMEYKHRRVLKVSAIKRWTNTLLCFTDGIACVGVCVSLSLCACIHKCVRECGRVRVRSAPALEDAPATVWVLQLHTWLAVFLLEARLHRHLGDLRHNNAKYDQMGHLRGEAAQNIWNAPTWQPNVSRFVAGCADRR